MINILSCDIINKSIILQIEKQYSVAKRAIECLGSMTPATTEDTLKIMITETLAKVSTV